MPAVMAGPCAVESRAADGDGGDYQGRRRRPSCKRRTNATPPRIPAGFERRAEIFFAEAREKTGLAVVTEGDSRRRSGYGRGICGSPPDWCAQHAELRLSR